ncbi:hypothetical protein [Salinicola sp. CR57]|uniref:hypothetical protein n=1 Tax=Salinicola sp. CR57 TaxID=1949086 RepID=UPI0013004F88|nr:hypothetical protein [Salinicola sp. CR57]
MKKPIDQKPPSTNVAYLQKSLGETVILFQTIDVNIGRIIFSCMTSSFRQIEIILSEISFRTKIDIMGSLLKFLHTDSDTFSDGTPVLVTLKELIKECEECERFRNTMLHTFWVTEFRKAPDLVLGMKSKAKHKQGYRYSVTDVSENSLELEIEKLKNLNEKLSSFREKLAYQFERMHGILGLESIIKHNEVNAFIQDSFIQRSQNK